MFMVRVIPLMTLISTRSTIDSHPASAASQSAPLLKKRKVLMTRAHALADNWIARDATFSDRNNEEYYNLEHPEFGHHQ